jgi:homoserine dehydrogenase
VTRAWREPPAGVSRGSAAASPAGPVRARLRAEELDIEHPLAALTGESLGAVLHTDLMADVVVSERHGLVPQTAYGVYADLLHLCRTS